MDLELFSVGAGQFVSLKATLVTAHASVPESSTPALMMVGPVLLVLRSHCPVAAVATLMLAARKSAALSGGLAAVPLTPFYEWPSKGTCAVFVSFPPPVSRPDRNEIRALTSSNHNDILRAPLAHIS